MISQQTPATAVTLLGRVDLLDLTPAALALAAQFPPPEVRTLDGLLIASAAQLADLDVLVTTTTGWPEPQWAMEFRSSPRAGDSPPLP